MASPSDRSALHAFVSDEAHRKWHEFAAREGCSVSALLEDLANRLEPDDTAATWSDQLDRLVIAARKIDSRRRSRRRAAA